MNIMGQDTLEQFKIKHLLWKKCIDIEDRNSVFNQIHSMIWNAAVFNVINNARKIAPVDAKGNREINGMIHRFMDRCFFDSQFLSIRRLADPAPIDGDRGVFSLLSLLNDMKINASLITRRNLFLVDNMEYDYEAAQQKEAVFMAEQLRAGASSYWLPPELDSHSIRLRHEYIDVLSGVDSGHRSPNDAIRVEVFDYLAKKIKDASEDIGLHVNKFIAHSASPESRDYSNVDDVKITLGHVWGAHKVICQVANFIDVSMISRASHNFLPIPQFNYFKFIDKAIVSSDGVAALSKIWDEFQKETEQWGSWGLKNLQNEMTQMK